MQTVTVTVAVVRHVFKTVLCPCLRARLSRGVDLTQRSLEKSDGKRVDAFLNRHWAAPMPEMPST